MITSWLQAPSLHEEWEKGGLCSQQPHSAPRGHCWLPVAQWGWVRGAVAGTWVTGLPRKAPESHDPSSCPWDSWVEGGTLPQSGRG